MNDKLQDVLFDDEEVLWQGKPKKACFILKRFGRLLPAAIIFLLFDAFFIGVTVAAGTFAEMRLFFVIFFIIHLLPVWQCIVKAVSSSIEHKNVVYAVTNRRIVLRTGIVGLDFEGVNYTDVSNVRVDISVLERIFGVGTLVVSTTAGKELCLLSVPEPYLLYKKVNKVLIDMKADMIFPNALRPDTNTGYHTNYTP